MKLPITILGALTVLLSGCSVEIATSMEQTLEKSVIDHKNNAVTPDYVLNTDYLLLYFSAHWCGPCRSFTPKLIDYYNEKQGGNLFQVLFISSDRNSTDMKNYMKETHMPWPAVIYHSKARKTLKSQYGGSGIPQLVLLDKKGKVLADSFKGKKYLGPQHVLNELDEKLKTRLEKRKIDPVGLSEITGEALPTPKKFSTEYRVDGFGTANGQSMAFINGKLMNTGDQLEKGAVIVKITDTYVEVSYEGNRYQLTPEP